MKNFKKLISMILAVMMISSALAMVLPVGAADSVAYPKQLSNNENVVVNGVTYRFDTLSQNSDSMAVVNPDNTITLTMKQGDLFWIPSVTLGNDSVLNMKVTLDSSENNKSQIACGLAYNIDAGADGVWGEDTDSLNVLNIRTNYRARIGYGTVAKMKGGNLTTEIKKVDFSANIPEAAKSLYNNSRVWERGKMLEMNLQLNDDTTVVASFRNDQSDEIASLSYTVDAEPKVFEGPVGFAVNWSGDINSTADGYMQITINSFEITNAVVNGVKSDFSLSSSMTYEDTTGVIVPMRLPQTTLDFDGEYAFIDLGFTIDESVSSDTEFVVKKNGEVVDRKALSTFTPVDGLYEYFTYFVGVQSTDVLTVCLEKDNAELARSSYDVEYGKSYQKYVTNPDPVSSAKLNVKVYTEDFEKPIVLVPGENIINGHKWTYIKNSTDGSAVIKNGRLHFTGSDYDMILFEDLNVDNLQYKMAYDVTYLETPGDDDWSQWDCWFGGLFYLADTADADGNKSAFVTSITPNDVYMMTGSFGANGVFTQKDGSSDHITFYNKPSEPTQGNNCYYWNERAGLGLPVTVSTFFGASNKDNGGVGMDGHTAQGSAIVSANLPGGVPSASKRTGSLGFVCSESKVSVIVDNLVVSVKGKTITVDGASFNVTATPQVDVVQFQKTGKQIVYAVVDGDVRYAGELVTANRLSQITTTQVSFSTGKVTAVGETGLKWTSKMSKADYEKLISDENISKVDVGTVVVLASNANNGITLEKAIKNIAGTATENGGNYVFEGVLDIDKESRDTTYSAVGYVKLTMKDGKEVVLYSEYIVRQHAFALSDLVDKFSDEIENEPETDKDDSNGNSSVDTSDKASSESTSADSNNTAEGKKGCQGSVHGIGTLLIVIVLLTSCVMLPKKSKE